MSRILGISAYYHDAAACLIEDGRIVAAAQEERFTRRKHDDSFPINAIRYCLEGGHAGGRHLDAVAFYDKPIDKFVRILVTHFGVAPRGLSMFLKAMPQWALRKLWVRSDIQNALSSLKVDPLPPVYFAEHHESHAASAFFPSPYREAAIVTMDGVGEWPTTTIGSGEGTRIKILKEQNFPHSLGLLYSAFTYYLGFTVNSDEYKVMGLAPYGTPRYKDRILDTLVRMYPDGSFSLNMDYFNYLGGLTMTNAAFDELFEGPVRASEAELTRHSMDVARSIQEATEEIVLSIVQHAWDTTKLDNLCLAGGVALNCVANGRLLKQGPFKSIWIAPAAGDAGGAVGSALAVAHHVFDTPRETNTDQDGMSGAYLGPVYENDAIEEFLRAENCPYQLLQADDWAKTIAELVDQGLVIGLFHGRMEFGPRALGNRSIIADARNPEMQSRINRKIKFRESFRPFAPAVLEEHCSEYFDLDTRSPYMLLTAPVAAEHRTAEAPDDPDRSLGDRLARVRSDIPAVTHIDYSARIQTVSRATNPAFHAIISAFREKTGCAVIVNTSFNVRGEPIVCTPKDAYHCFMKTEMDCLVLQNCLIQKSKLRK